MQRIHITHFVDLHDQRMIYTQGHLSRMNGNGFISGDGSPMSDEQKEAMIDRNSDTYQASWVDIPTEACRLHLLTLSPDELATIALLDAAIAPFRNEKLFYEPLVMPTPLPIADGTQMNAREVFAEGGREVDLMNAASFLPVLRECSPELFEHLEDPDRYGIYDEHVVVRSVASYHDSRDYSWDLLTMTYRGEPVMIMQKAGESDDRTRSFIVNLPLFKEVNAYIFSLARFPEIDTEDCVLLDMNETREDIHAFDHESMFTIRARNERDDAERTLARRIADRSPELAGYWVVVDADENIVAQAKTAEDQAIRTANKTKTNTRLRIPGMIS